MFVLVQGYIIHPIEVFQKVRLRETEVIVGGVILYLHCQIYILDVFVFFETIFIKGSLSRSTLLVCDSVGAACDSVDAAVFCVSVATVVVFEGFVVAFEFDSVATIVALEGPPVLAVDTKEGFDPVVTVVLFEGPVFSVDTKEGL